MGETGAFWEPGICTFGVLPKNLCAGVPSNGLELGVLLRKNTILCRGVPLSFRFSFIEYLRICTAASAWPLDSLFLGEEWLMFIPKLFAQIVKVSEATCIVTPDLIRCAKLVDDTLQNLDNCVCGQVICLLAKQESSGPVNNYQIVFGCIVHVVHV